MPLPGNNLRDNNFMKPFVTTELKEPATPVFESGDSRELLEQLRYRQTRLNNCGEYENATDPLRIEAADRIEELEKARRDMMTKWGHCVGTNDELKRQIVKLETALENIKKLVCGEAAPNWENTPRTGSTRGFIADIIDKALEHV